MASTCFPNGTRLQREYPFLATRLTGFLMVANDVSRPARPSTFSAAAGIGTRRTELPVAFLKEPPPASGRGRMRRRGRPVRLPGYARAPHRPSETAGRFDTCGTCVRDGEVRRRKTRDREAGQPRIGAGNEPSRFVRSESAVQGRAFVISGSAGTSRPAVPACS